MSISSDLLGRASEWAALEDAWDAATRGEPQLVVLWGRRRVGKTFLASTFARDKRAVFFGATRQAPAVELRRLDRAVRRGLGERTARLTAGGLTDWEAALDFFAVQAEEEPLMVVLDEVPYLAESTPGFASIVQVVWDHLRAGTRLMLVLIGSAVGTMERMLGGGGALHGRPTVRMRLDPMGLVEARAFLPDLPAQPYFEAYAACGGYPLHLRAWDPGVDTATNLERLAGTTGGMLVEDAHGILREELPSVGGYSRILAAVGRGRSRASDIAGEAEQRIEKPLKVLVESGFVRRSLPLGAPRKARPLYELADPYLAFWFGVLYTELPLIEAGQGIAALERRRPQWDRHLSWVFEEAARAHAQRLARAEEASPGLVIGRWWASSGQPCEIDVLGLVGNNAVLIGEVKWRGRPLGLRVLRELMAKGPRLPWGTATPRWALWGRAGVEDAVRDAGAVGYSLEDVLSP